MIEVFSYGQLDGKDVQGFTLSNEQGFSLTLMSYGARITKLLVPDRNGVAADIVLGFDTLEDYVASGAYHGAVCGRYGNRIARGHLVAGGETWQLSRNDGGNHLHGGFSGFDRKNWIGTANETHNSVTFRSFSPHLEEGFPGHLDMSVTYRLTPDDTIDIEFRATTDMDTAVSMINHSYWNLAGEGDGKISDHVLQISTDFYVPTNDEVIPTGEILSVKKTKFDFSSPKPIGQHMTQAEPGKQGYMNNPENMGGYDATWVLGSGGEMKPAVRVYHPDTGRGFELFTTEPCVQFYTASYLDDPVPGKSGRPYGRHSGITFEPQKLPDAPNVPHFPSAILKVEDTYLSRQRYRFFART